MKLSTTISFGRLGRAVRLLFEGKLDDDVASRCSGGDVMAARCKA